MKLEKLIQKLGIDTANEMVQLDKEGIKSRIVIAEQAMKQAQDELESNPKYQELKENLKALTLGKKEVNARQRAIIAYSLHLLAEKGE